MEHSVARPRSVCVDEITGLAVLTRGHSSYQ